MKAQWSHVQGVGKRGRRPECFRGLDARMQRSAREGRQDEEKVSGVRLEEHVFMLTSTWCFYRLFETPFLSQQGCGGRQDPVTG